MELVRGGAPQLDVGAGSVPAAIGCGLVRIDKGTRLKYDVAIVGAGSAGCVLANRLGQGASQSVLPEGWPRLSRLGANAC